MSRSRKYIYLIVTLFSINANAQGVFEKLGNGVPGSVHVLNNANSVLYVGGFNWPNANSPLYKWQNQQWDSISDLNGVGIRDIEFYDNRLFIGQAGWQFTGCAGIVTFDFGTQWEFIEATADNNCGTVWDFYVLNNDLYACGIFDSIAGIKASKIAKYDGSNWTSLPVLDSSVTFGITDMIYYKGELYVGGNFSATCCPFMEDIARFDGTQWQPLGNGLTGGNTIVNKFYIYDSLLIVAGYFQTSSGDPGNNIVAWDGNNWIQLGDGLMPSNVYDVIEYDNKLFACGQISYLPDLTPINRMAVWDGIEWTDAGADFLNSTGGDGTPLDMTVMNNELYIGGGFFTVNGDTVNNIVKYKVLTGIEEENESFIKYYPNPATDFLHLENNSGEEINFAIYSITGQIISTTILSNQLNYRHDISALPKGFYLIVCESKSGKKFTERLVVN